MERLEEFSTKKEIHFIEAAEISIFHVLTPAVTSEHIIATGNRKRFEGLPEIF
jgi:hypothetical protein